MEISSQYPMTFVLGNNFVKKYFTNPGNASKTLSEYLK